MKLPILMVNLVTVIFTGSFLGILLIGFFFGERPRWPLYERAFLVVGAVYFAPLFLYAVAAKGFGVPKLCALRQAGQPGKDWRTGLFVFGATLVFIGVIFGFLNTYTLLQVRSLAPSKSEVTFGVVIGVGSRDYDRPADRVSYSYTLDGGVLSGSAEEDADFVGGLKPGDALAIRYSFEYPAVSRIERERPVDDMYSVRSGWVVVSIFIVGGLILMAIIETMLDLKSEGVG